MSFLGGFTFKNTISESWSEPLIRRLETYLMFGGALLYWPKFMSLIEEVSGANTANYDVVYAFK